MRELTDQNNKDKDTNSVICRPLDNIILIILYCKVKRFILFHIEVNISYWFYFKLIKSIMAGFELSISLYQISCPTKVSVLLLDQPSVCISKHNLVNSVCISKQNLLNF